MAPKKFYNMTYWQWSNWQRDMRNVYRKMFPMKERRNWDYYKNNTSDATKKWWDEKYGEA
jgi:hypothetical protein